MPADAVTVTTPAAQASPETMSNEEYRAYRSGAPAKVQETKPAAQAETPAESETATLDDEQDGETVAQAAVEPAKPSGIQKRFDKLTATNTELRNRLALLEAQVVAKTPAKAEESKTPAPAKADAQQADAEPASKDFETYEDWLKAWSRWDRAQEAKASDAAARERSAEEQRKAQQKAGAARLEAAKVKYPDFDAVLSAADAKVQPSKEIVDWIGASDLGADVAYYLATHVAETEAIAKLPAIAARKALAKIEAQFEAAETAADPDGGEEAEATPKVSAAPAPIKPVAARSASAGKRVETMSNEEYRAARESGRLK